MTDYSMYRGDSLILDLEIKQGDVPVDLTDATIWMTAKKKLSDPDGSAVFQIETPADILIDANPLLGKARVVVPAASTTALKYSQDCGTIRLHYDIQVKTVTGIIQTVAVGILSVLEDVTEAVT